MSLDAGIWADPSRTAGPISDNSARRARDREVGEDAERAVESPDETPVSDRPSSVTDDAPHVDDVPQLPWDDNEDPPISDDGERDLPDRTPSWDPWIRLSIFRGRSGFAWHVEFPDTTDPALEDNLDQQHRNWDGLAGTLIALQPDALGCRTPLEALGRLWAVTKAQVERSVGQLSRDRHFVIGTPFGDVPLDFMFLGRRTLGGEDTLYRDLRKAGEQLVAAGVASLSAPDLRRLLPHLDNNGIDSTLNHVAALGKVLAQPQVVQRHRQFWPRTTTDALYDDLGAKPRSTDRSAPAGILAILGAFEQGSPVLARGIVPPLRRGVRRP